MLPLLPFIFVRHGQTDWNVVGRMQGKTDIPLNDEGVRQAYLAAERLAGHAFEVIVSSDLCRASATADVIAKSRELLVELDSGLQERSFGSFEGLITAEVRAAHQLKPEDSITKILPLDAEQWPDTKARVIRVMGSILERHAGKRVLVVSHGAFFRALYECLGGPRMEAKNATPYLFSPVGETWELVTL